MEPTHQKPRLKTPKTMALFFMGIGKFQINGAGRRTIAKSRNMFTDTDANSCWVPDLQFVCDSTGSHIADMGMHMVIKYGMKAKAYAVVIAMKK